MNAEETMETKASIVRCKVYLYINEMVSINFATNIFQSCDQIFTTSCKFATRLFFLFSSPGLLHRYHRGHSRGGGEVLGKIPSVGEVWIFSGITQLNSMVNPNMFVMIVADSEVELYMYLMSNTLFQHMLISTFEL